MAEFQFQFEKLDTWKESRKLVVQVYKLLESFPKIEQYALCDQLRRAAISIPSNIAEGSGRMAIKEYVHFLEIAFGSLMEVYCQLQIAVDLGYITIEDLHGIKPLIFSISRMLSRLRTAKLAQLDNKGNG